MKKPIKIVSICGAAVFVIFIIICRMMSQSYEYDIGRDTYKAFGNREYQLINYTSAMGNKQRCLYNLKYNESIIDNVYAYKIYGNYVYFCNDDDSIYVKLNKQNNRIIYISENGCNLMSLNDMIINNDIKVVTVFKDINREDQLRFEELYFQ